MKKVFIIIGIVLVFCILGVGIYCIPNKTVKEVYNEFLKTDSYKQWKKYYSGVRFKEYAIHDKIIVKTNNGSLKSTFKYQIDDQYLTYTHKSDYFNNGFDYFKCIMDVFADRYHMDKDYLRLYVDTLMKQGKSTDYFIIEEKGSYTKCKLYIKEKFDLPIMDDLYLQEGDLVEYLEDMDDGFYLEIGKMNIHVSRNDDKVITIYVAEYTNNTNVTYQSIINAVKDIKPKYYQEFLNEFKEIKEISSEKYGYTVKKLSEQESKELGFYVNGYQYIKIIFSKN